VRSISVEKRTSLSSNLLLSAAVSVLFLGGLEALCRLVERPRPVSTDAALEDPEGGGHFYTLKKRPLGWPPDEVNAAGVRDRPHALEKPRDTWRLVVLGDSVTEGFGVEPDLAFPRVLQRRLDAAGERVEVLSLAVRGWSTRQQRIAWHRIARRYRPDEAIVAVCLNDVVELEHQLRTPPALLATLHRRSALVRRVVDASRREMRSVEALLLEVRTYDSFLDELRALARDVRADGASVAVVVLPYRFQLAPDAPPPRVQAAVSAFCAREGLRCLDLLPAFRDRGESAFIDENHLSGAGAAVVAEAIARAGLVPERSFVPALLGRLREKGDRAAGALEWIAAVRGDARAGVSDRAGALPRDGAGPARAVPVLLETLDDPDREVRAAAAWALSRIGTGAAPARGRLVHALGDPDETVRASAAAALAALGPSLAGAEPALLAALADERAAVRWEAVRALAGLDLGGHVDALVRALRSPDEYVRNFAAWRLGEMRATSAAAALVEALSGEEAYEMQGVAEAVRKLGPAVRQVVPAVAAGLSNADAARRAAAALTLAKIGPEAVSAVPELSRCLADPDAAVRANAALALGGIGPPAGAATPLLVTALADREAWVRAEAARALGKVAREGGAAVDRLVAALDDPDPAVRTQAARALGRLGRRAKPVTDALARALRDEDIRVQREAQQALERLRR
jgi:HEAT repeat protein/lysophospholipase L1-like esterase